MTDPERSGGDRVVVWVAQPARHNASRDRPESDELLFTARWCARLALLPTQPDRSGVVACVLPALLLRTEPDIYPAVAARVCAFDPQRSISLEIIMATSGTWEPRALKKRKETFNVGSSSTFVPSTSAIGRQIDMEEARKAEVAGASEFKGAADLDDLEEGDE